MEPNRIAYESMGTSWQILIWDQVVPADLEALKQDIVAKSEEFNKIYSRFMRDSFVSSIADKTGEIEVPGDFVKMLKMYKTLNEASDGKINPLIGFSISDLGYDSEYSFNKKENVRITPDFNTTVKILDDSHISISQPVLFDFGALGKGYFVEIIKNHLTELGYEEFLVDGSGDSAYVGRGNKARIGLEHPDDPKKVIGVLEISGGAVCASANNRRKWGEMSHTVDPHSLKSPEEIIATWVWSDNAALADGLATALFMCDPETLQKNFMFEYCLMNKERKLKRSTGFAAELF